MERQSNIQLRQSYVFNTSSNNVNRSFISTAIGADSLGYGDELRKSRIQNLPNYKKTNLWENLQFIVVFQTIEIERLSQEVEVGRVRLKECERQIFNAQNYEVQIRELSQKCVNQQRQISEYREQYEKLNKICETLYHQNEMLKNKLNDMDFSLKQKYEFEKNKNIELTQQVEKWRVRYQACEKSKSKELEDMRNMMESQRQSMISRQIKQITIRFENERATAENELRKFREALDNRNRQIGDLKQKCQKSDTIIMELRNYENVIADYENKQILLGQELSRLNQILRDKQEQIYGIKQREFKLNQQVKEQKQWEYESKQLRSSLEAKIKESQEWKLKAGRLEDELVRGRELAHYNQQLGNKLGLASRQLERLNNILKNKIDQIQQWKRKVNQKDSEISRYKNMEHELQSYENKINSSKIENDRINGILKSRLTQIQDWKKKYNLLDSTVKNYGGIEKDKKMLEDKFNGQIKVNQELKSVVIRMENDLAMNRKKDEVLKEAERVNSGLNKEIERLNNSLRNTSNDINNLRMRNTKLENSLLQYQNYEIKINDNQNTIKQLNQQLQKLDDLLKERNREITQLDKQKIELHSRLNEFKNYQLDIKEREQTAMRLEDKVRNLATEVDSWKTKCKDYQMKAKEKEQVLQRTMQEKEREKQNLNRLLREKNNEFSELSNNYSRLESQCRKKSEYETACQGQSRQIMNMQGDLDGYEQRLKAMEQELEMERTQSNQFAFKIIVLSCQIQRLSATGSSNSKIKSKQFAQLQQNHSKMQSKMQSKNSQIQILLTRIRELDNKVSSLRRDYSNMLTEVEKSHAETLQLLKKIQQYQGYATKINILSVEIDRLEAENKKLDDQIKKMRLKYSDKINMERNQQMSNLQTVIMAAQIQSLRIRIQQREVSANQLRKSILEPVRKI